jgi:hypothetical protein
MMKTVTSRLIFVSFLLFLSSSMCGILSSTPLALQIDQSATDTAATLVALEASLTLSVPTVTSEPRTGSLSGNLSYPSEFIPPLRVVATDVLTDQYYYVDTLKDQFTYSIDNLPPGTYHVIAYYTPLDVHTGQPGPSTLAAGYSQSVLCGLTVDCSDHSLIDVVVEPGQTVTDIDPGDWYASEGTFPPDPTQ